MIGSLQREGPHLRVAADKKVESVNALAVGLGRIGEQCFKAVDVRRSNHLFVALRDVQLEMSVERGLREPELPGDRALRGAGRTQVINTRALRVLTNMALNERRSPSAG